MARPTLVDKVEAMAALACVPGLRPSTLKVGIRLLHHYNCKSGRCDPGIQTLAHATGLSERAVYRAISELEKLGLVRILHCRGRGNTNMYAPEFEMIERYNPPPRSALTGYERKFDKTLTVGTRKPDSGTHKPDQLGPENLTAVSGEHMNEHVNEHVNERVSLCGFADYRKLPDSLDSDTAQKDSAEGQRDDDTPCFAWWAEQLESRGIEKPMGFLFRTLMRVTEESGLEPSEAMRLVIDCLPEAIDDPPIDISLNRQLTQAIAELDGDHS